MDSLSRGEIIADRDLHMSGRGRGSGSYDVGLPCESCEERIGAGEDLPGKASARSAREAERYIPHPPRPRLGLTPVSAPICSSVTCVLVVFLNGERGGESGRPTQKGLVLHTPQGTDVIPHPASSSASCRYRMPASCPSFNSCFKVLSSTSNLDNPIAN